MRRIFKTMIISICFLNCIQIQSQDVIASINFMGNEVNINNMNDKRNCGCLEAQIEGVYIDGILSLDGMIDKIEIENEDNYQSFNNKDSLTVSRDKHPVEIILYVMFEKDSKMDFSQLIAEFEIVDKHGRQIDTFISNQEGRGIWKGSLEIGSYVIKEIKTAPEYVINERWFGFNVIGKANEVILVNEGEVIVNRLKQYAIHQIDNIEKIDSEFSLYDTELKFSDNVLEDTLSKRELFEDIEFTLIKQRKGKPYVNTAVLVKQNDYEDALLAVVMASILLLIIIGYKRYKNSI